MPRAKVRTRFTPYQRQRTARRIQAYAPKNVTVRVDDYSFGPFVKYGITFAYTTQRGNKFSICEYVSSLDLTEQNIEIISRRLTLDKAGINRQIQLIRMRERRARQNAWLMVFDYQKGDNRNIRVRSDLV